MQTVALPGTASMITLVFGIPVEIWCGYRWRTAVIALFGFGIAPVIRQTSFGITNVPPAVHEAALAFGAGLQH